MSNLSTVGSRSNAVMSAFSIENWELYVLRINERLTTRQLGDVLGISQPYARKLLRERGFEPRKRTDYAPSIPKGTKFTEEHKQKIAVALTGNQNWLNHKTNKHHNNRRSVVACATCGVVVEKKGRHVANAKSNYCGMKCLGIANGKKRKGTAVLVDVQCAQCGVSLKRRPCQVKKHSFCSQKCTGIWKATHLVGDKVYNFIGGEWKNRYYGEDWVRRRREARKRDNDTCQRCGITKAEYGKNLDVHHIIPWRYFGAERRLEANKLSNLVCLCNVCHKIVEEQTTFSNN